MIANEKMKCKPTIRQGTATRMTQKGGKRAKHYQH